jgi:colicin import membrane protein
MTTANKAPLAEVNEQGGKEKLVDRIMGLIDRGEEDADTFKRRLLAASNKKLVRLAQIGETMKKDFGGSRDKLVESVAKAVGRANDSDYVRALSTYSPGQLLDMLKTAGRKVESQARGAAEKVKAAAKGAAREAGETATKAVAKVATRAKAAAKGAATKAKAAAKGAASKAKAAAKKPTTRKK